jgi:signal transduction histidine kinase
MQKDDDMTATITDEDCFSQITKLNAKLIESESSKTRFLSLIRNEFDNPMVGMVTLLRQLNTQGADHLDEDYKETLHLIYMDALKLNYQLSNIISVASVETGVLERNTTIFNIASMLNDIDDSLRHIFETKSLKVTKNIQCSEEVFNDRDKIYTILSNLIANAYEYCTPSTEVEISIFEDDNKLFISVRNRGDKIKDPKAIFDAFYQQKQGFSRTHQGLGIGLSVVGAFVDFLGGDIFISRDADSNVFVASIPSIDQDGAIGFGGELDAFLFDD